MQTEVLREFLVVANLLNFRRAAGELHITQPALSKHIAALERELGFSLFDRTGSTKLTAEGSHFVVYAQRILNTLEEAIECCSALTAQTPPVRLLWNDESSGVLRKMFPLITTPFSLVAEMVNESAVDLLKTGQIDTAPLYNIEDIPELAEELARNGLAAASLGSERLSIVLSRSNPLAAKERPCRADLREAEIYLGHGLRFENQAQATEAILGKDLNLKFVFDPTLVMAGTTISFYNPAQGMIVAFSSLVHATCSDRADLKILDELDGRPIVVDEYLVYRADDPNPNVRAFVEEVSTLASQNESPA